MSSAVAGTAALGLGACARGTNNPDPDVLRLGHNYGTGSLQNRASQRFADAVAERSGGAIEVEIYPSGQLGGYEDMQEGLEIGSMHFVLESVGSLERYTTLASIEGIPFLYDSDEHFLKVWDSDLGDEIIQGIREDSGFLLLGKMYRGPRVLNSARPVEDLDDAAGLKLRVPTQETYISTWRNLGAAPTPLALTEVFSAMEQGAVDGQENPIDVVRFNSFFEVAPYVTNTNHLYGNFHLQTWGETYDTWSDGTREVIDGAVEEVSDWYRKASIDETKENIEFLKDEGVEFFDIDMDEWKDAASAVVENASPKVREWSRKIEEARP